MGLHFLAGNISPSQEDAQSWCLWWQGCVCAHSRAVTTQVGASEALQHNSGIKVRICIPLAMLNRSAAAPMVHLSQK